MKPLPVIGRPDELATLSSLLGRKLRTVGGPVFDAILTAMYQLLSSKKPKEAILKPEELIGDEE